MLRIFFVSIALLSFLQSSAYSFYLYNYQIFNEQEEVVVTLYDYDYNYDGQSRKPIHFSLVKFESIDGLKELIPLQDDAVVPDNVISKYGKELKSWEYELPGSNQYNYYQTINLGKLQNGYYLLEGYRMGQIVHCPIIVSNSVLTTSIVGDDLSIFLADGETGRSRSTFEMFALDWSGWKSPIRVDKGMAKFDLEANEGGQIKNAPVFAFKNGNIAFSTSYLNYYYGISNPTKFQVSTNAPAYRPGSIAVVKGYARDMDGYKLKVPEDSVLMVVYDPEYNEIHKTNIQMDEYGGFSDSLEIPKDAKLGSYQVRVMLGNEYVYYYNQVDYNFEVQEYKKPEYEVIVEFDRDGYEAGEKIEATINGAYFFGGPVKNAEVSYRWYRSPKYPNFYSSYYWWYRYDYVGYGYQSTEMVEYGSAQLDENGDATVSLTIPSRLDLNYTYTLSAEVTDAARRTITGSSTTDVVYTQLSMVAFPEKNYYRVGDSAKIIIQTQDLSGNPKGVSVSWKANKGAIGEIITDSLTGMSILAIPVEEGGSVKIELACKDENGTKIETVARFYAFDENQNSAWWESYNSSLQIYLENDGVEAGDSLKFMVTVPSGRDLFVQISGSDLISQELIEAMQRNGRAFDLIEYACVIPEDAFGTAQVTIGYVSDFRFNSANKQFTIRKQDAQLNVSVEFDKKAYQAGELASATIKVTDVNGNPVPDAHVNLGTLDNSLLFLYPDKSKSLYESFYKTSNFQVPGLSSNSASFYKYSQICAPSTYKSRLMQMDEEARYPESQSNPNIWLVSSLTMERKGHFTGFVFDHEGKSAPNSKVKIGDRSFRTDKDGYFDISGFSDTGTADLTFIFGDGQVIIESMMFNPEAGSYCYVKVPQKDEIIVPASNYTYAWDFEFQQNRGLDGNGAAIMTDQLFMAEVEESSVSFEDVTVTTGAMQSRGSRKMASFNSIDVGGGIDDYKQGQEFAATKVRTDFKDAAFYADELITDKNGEITVQIPFPDNLTTWRSLARVITKDGKVGEAEVKTLVTKDLLVRLETPRFMTQGDEMKLASTVHNYLPREKRVKLSLSLKGLAGETEAQWVKVPAQGEVRVDWLVKADWIGEAEVAIKAETDEVSDAKLIKFPIQPKGIQYIKAMSAYLLNRDRKNIDFEVPESAIMNSSYATLTLSPSMSSGLLASLQDLIGYPYGCVEQTMSRFLPNVIVAKVMEDIPGAGKEIDNAELDKMVAQGFQRLAELQHSDGGWGWWTNDETHPFMTAYVCYGLTLAEQNGYQIPSNMLSNGLGNLSNQIQSGKVDDPATAAYQMMVAMLAGKEDLWKEPKKAPEKMGSYELSLWIQAAALAEKNQLAQKWAEILKEQSISEGSWTYWGDKKFYYSWQEDRVETTANAVKALLMVEPNAEAIPAATQWLMDQRKGQSWHNTRQTAMTVYALADMIKREIGTNTEVIVRLNGAEIARFEVEGSSALTGGKTITIHPERYEASLEEGEVDIISGLVSGENRITLQQEGEGTLYASLRVNYFAEKVDPEAETGSFDVSRTWFLLKPDQKRNEVIYQKSELVSGSIIPSGELLLAEVTVTVESDNQQYVLIEDPIPAGCEFVRELEGYNVEGIGQLEGFQTSRNYWYYNYWYTHQEYRDNRMAITVTNLPKGTYTYRYLIRTQLPGAYNLNPTVAQLMYYPEVRGCSDFSEITITERAGN